MRLKGRFITFEGGDGSGKSTQIGILAEKLEAKGISTYITREPGGTVIGEKVRGILKDNEESWNMCGETELLLFGAARAQIVREVIIPKLTEGVWVLCDRFIDSTVVYQGMGRGLDLLFIERLNEFTTNGILPDLTVILEVGVKVSMERIGGREGRDRMENESIGFYEAIRNGYLKIREGHPERCVLVRGENSIEKIREEIWDEVRKRFGLN